jgi:hypothetical protein
MFFCIESLSFYVGAWSPSLAVSGFGNQTPTRFWIMQQLLVSFSLTFLRLTLVDIIGKRRLTLFSKQQLLVYTIIILIDINSEKSL